MDVISPPLIPVLAIQKQPVLLLVPKIAEQLSWVESQGIFFAAVMVHNDSGKNFLLCRLIGSKCITVSPLQSHPTSPPSQHLGLPLVSNCHK